MPDLGGGIREQPHAGGTVRVTTLERTPIDVLDAPGKGAGWEEIWRSLELVEFFDLDAVIEYVGKLGSALAAARVGFFLEQHREALMVEDGPLDSLVRLAPGQPRNLDPERRPGKFVSRWNLAHAAQAGCPATPVNWTRHRWFSTVASLVYDAGQVIVRIIRPGRWDAGRQKGKK